jgi:type 1 fimbria pilin
MQKISLFLAAPVALLLLSNIAMATTSSNLAVTGQISPPTCGISLTGGGNVDFGTFNLSSLNRTSNTLFHAGPTQGGVNSPVATTMNITCNAPALIAVSFTDNRASTANYEVSGIGAPGVTRLYNNRTLFGLGRDGKGTAIGGYTLWLGDNTTVDGTAGHMIQSSNSGVNWGDPVGKVTVQNVFAWTLYSSNTFGPVTTVTQLLGIDLAIIKSTALDASMPTNLDGSVTLEMKYL